MPIFTVNARCCLLSRVGVSGTRFAFLAVCMDACSEGFSMKRKAPAVLLVVEDDRDMRSLLCDELWGEGYQLQEASTGEEGLAVAMRAAPDLIVTDLTMPSGGFDYVHRLRRCVPGCPIIVMTAFGDAQTRDEAMKNGATAYFDKPVRLSELKATVKHLLRHPGAQSDGQVVH